ncbi:MAG: IclR family transcriptional regulator [Arachnia sp.]
MVQAVDRAVQVLQICAKGPALVDDIAETVGVHRTTALRIIQSLEAGGLLRRDGDRKFVIGYGLYALASPQPSDVDLRAVIGPRLRTLAADTGFSVHCAIPADDRIVSLDFVEPPYSIRLPLRVGGNVVIHTAGVAKAMLAHLEPSHRDRILANATWERYTDRTITHPEEMHAVLESVRNRGWAYDDGEFDEVSNCIAGAFFDYSGQVVGAISLTAFKPQMPLDLMETSVPRLQQELRELSHQFGFKPSEE